MDVAAGEESTQFVVIAVNEDTRMGEFVNLFQRLIMDNADFQVVNLGDQEGFRALGDEVPMDLPPPTIEGLADIIPDSDVTRPEDGWYPLPDRDDYLAVDLDQWR